ncbi:sulfatase-like hydrolase/transferase [Flavivirga sp. 57AJ16]|uniref:sulfatase-like hydrolase/transferase n=1 Tax=Flavivirga sp. 57AJ16 TaxID=3025307 RepID=UPI0023672C1E|nr:sulfatase-like hydrolase/transferase [Flavivirga sp. 57AJ16]MDD7885443.1 sulfatase-like hydrolase/transferase [Flavivirga sp. 57AJ16]
MRKKVIGRMIIVILLLVSNLDLGAQDKRPNIVLILADDLGVETITANGGTSYQTPNIDRLASQGMLFQNCHAQPLCTPSRVQIMTGQYNVRNYTEFGKLDRSQISFGNIFKNAGYKTAIAGKWQLGGENDSPQHFGFDESCLWQQSQPRKDSEGHDTRFSNPTLEFNGKVKHFNNGEYGPDITSNFICDFIEENKNEPFFAYYPMILTHCPFVTTPDSNDWDSQSKGSLTYKGEPVYYADMVSYMDKLVGKIVSKIDELGLGENTLIVFTGDNGTDQPIVSMFKGGEYPGGKGKTTDNGTHVPLVARWTGTIDGNKECLDMVDFSDFLPTICDAASIKAPSNIPIDGISFMPQLLGKKGNPREWIYSWYDPRGKKLKEFARNTEYKLYKTGEFYNVTDDFFEKAPIPLDNLKEKDKKAYKSLSKALNSYDNVQKIK